MRSGPNKRARGLAALFAVSMLLVSAHAAGETGEEHRLAFAESLEREGDTFRAIGVYKELAFDAPDAGSRARFELRIASLYRRSGRYMAGIDAATRALRTAPVPPLRESAKLELGAAFVGLQSASQARAWLEPLRGSATQPYASLFLGLASAQEGNDEGARSEFAAFEAAVSEPETKAWAKAIAERADRVHTTPKRSPLLAATMSAVVPGLGQAYGGHWVDALQAIGFVSAFSTATYASYRYDADHGGPYVLTTVTGTILAVFYAANIVGAYRTATYFNERQRQASIEPLRQAVLSIAPPVRATTEP